MNEKEKRKQELNHGCFGWQIVSLSLLSTLIIAAWFFVYANSPCACSFVIPETQTVIVATNRWALTQISATETAEATTHNSSNTRATETMEYVQTLAHVRETMTALGDWSWREATATAAAEATLVFVFQTATALDDLGLHSPTPTPNQ